MPSPLLPLLVRPFATVGVLTLILLGLVELAAHNMASNVDISMPATVPAMPRSPIFS